MLTARPKKTTVRRDKLLELRGVDLNVFYAREPKASDLPDIIECAKDAIGGVDYLPSYFLRYLQQPNRRSCVVVHKPTDRVIFFTSQLFIDDGKTAVSSSSRTRVDMRKKGCAMIGAAMLEKSMRDAYPLCNQVVGVTRHDNVVLNPRYFGEVQVNKLLGTNYVLNVSSDFSAVEDLAHKLPQCNDLSVLQIPFSQTSRILSPSKHITQLLISEEFVVFDSFPYRLSCDSNFSRYPDLFNTKVYVGSRKRDLSQLDVSSPDAETLSAIDCASFVNTNATQAGLHFKIYVYTASLDSLVGHLRHALFDCLDDLRAIRHAPDVGTFTDNRDKVQYTIAFPIALKAEDVRKRMLDAGFQPGVTGLDIQRQYMTEDDSSLFFLRSKL